MSRVLSALGSKAAARRGEAKYDRHPRDAKAFMSKYILKGVEDRDHKMDV